MHCKFSIAPSKSEIKLRLNLFNHRSDYIGLKYIKSLPILYMKINCNEKNEDRKLTENNDLVQKQFSSDHQNFAVCLRLDISLGALIMTFIRPLFQATYEVILLYTSSICKKVFDT